jgi:hypothetical protein
MIDEIQSLQDLVVMAPGIDMEEVHVPYSISFEDISRGAYFDCTFDVEKL